MDGRAELAQREVDAAHGGAEGLIQAHALLYNIIRLLMWEAATASGRDPRRASFAGTLHRLQRLGPSLLARVENGESAGSLGASRAALLAVLLAWTVLDVLPSRPGRVEPRRVKRRPKNYSRLTLPRAHYRTHGDLSCR